METSQSVKEQAAELIQSLPDDCSMDDIQYHLYVLEKVRLGLKDADAGCLYTTEQAKQRLKHWL